MRRKFQLERQTSGLRKYLLSLSGLFLKVLLFDWFFQV